MKYAELRVHVSGDEHINTKEELEEPIFPQEWRAKDPILEGRNTYFATLKNVAEYITKYPHEEIISEWNNRPMSENWKNKVLKTYKEFYE